MVLELVSGYYAIMGIMKTISKVLLLLFGGIIVGYLLLVMVFCLPLGRVKNNVVRSASSFGDGYHILVDGFITTKTDDYTDALMLLTAENGADRNPFTAPIYAYHAAQDKKEPYDVINDLGNPLNKQQAYSRYWHGYLLLLKPLLLLFSYSQIQIIISVAVVMLIAGVFFLLQKRKMDKYIIPYVLMVAVIFPAVVSWSMQYFAVFAICNIAIMAELIFHEKIKQSKNYILFFLIIGMVTCYFDLLTYPVVTLGVPLLVWLLFCNGNEPMKKIDNIKHLIVGGLMWCLGYFGVWAGKWILGSIITGENLFNTALKAAEARTSSATEIEDISRTAAIEEAFKNVFTESFWFVLFVLILVIGIFLLIKKIRINRRKAIDNLWILLVSIIPIVWYLVMANHSYWHMFFTYRTLSVFIFAIGCYIASLIEIHQKKKMRDNNG